LFWWKKNQLCIKINFQSKDELAFLNFQNFLLWIVHRRSSLAHKFL
jgi:hypothetical protein